MEMTRQKAFELLFLQEDATIEQIKQKYWALYNEYDYSHTNAPTDTLKRKFNEKLENLNTAFQLLCPDTSLDDLKGQNLPIDSPIFNISSVYTRPERVENREFPKTGTKTNYKILLFAGFVLILGIAIGVYAILSIREYKTKLDDTKVNFENATDTLMIYKRFADPIFKNSKFRIENRFSESIEIRWVAGLYEKNGIMENFDSKYDYDKPGTTEYANSKIASEGKKDIKLIGYDGEVIYYVIVYYKAGQTFWKSGFFARDQRDKSVVLEP